MATNFPASDDDNTTLPNPSATSKTNNPSLSSGQSNQNDAIKAIEAKLGTGSSTPVNNRLLYGNGTGTSAWTQLTSAQLSASLSDETGSGSAVFGTTPTLVTPKVDTINESTPANGVTIDGLNIKDNKLNTNNSVVTANITNAAVTADKLATGGQMAEVATSQTTTSTSYADLATVGPAVTVVVGANGLALVSIAASLTNSNVGGYAIMAFAVSGATTTAAQDKYGVFTNVPTAAAAQRLGATYLISGLTPGSTTFTCKYKVISNTGTFDNRYIGVVPL